MKALLAALPELMKNFREAIDKDLNDNPEIRKRLPKSYRDAYLMIE